MYASSVKVNVAGVVSVKEHMSANIISETRVLPISLQPTRHLRRRVNLSYLKIELSKRQNNRFISTDRSNVRSRIVVAMEKRVLISFLLASCVAGKNSAHSFLFFKNEEARFYVQFNRLVHARSNFSTLVHALNIKHL